MSERRNIKDVFDACALMAKEIDDNFKKDNNYEPPKEDLETLRAAFADIVDFEKMFLIKAEDKMYGTLLMGIETTIDFNQRGPLNFDPSKNPIVFSFNPLFISGKYTFPEFTALIISELLKIVFLHPADYAKHNSEKDPRKHDNLEKSSAVTTNNMVSDDIRLDSRTNNCLRLPKDAFTRNDLYSLCKVNTQRGQTLEYYYQILNKFRKDDENNQSGGASGDNQQNNQGGGNNQQNQNQNGGNGDFNSNSGGSENGIASPSNKNGRSVHDWESGDEENIENNMKTTVITAYNSIPEQSRGFIAGKISEQIANMCKPPEINWKQYLRKMVGNVPVPYRRTKMRLNRRQPERADLSGKLPKHVVSIVCVFDTSGSMSSRCLTYCMNEVFNIVKVYEGVEITVVECDAEINKVYTAKTIKDLQLKMKGRGGTSFVPAIEFINGTNADIKRKYPQSGNFKDALMVYFTDGYGDYEIPKPRTYKNLWVVLDDVKNLSLKEPYGEVKSLAMDADWIKQVKDYDW